MRLILPLQAVISFLSFFNKITEETFPKLKKNIPYDTRSTQSLN